MPSFQKIVVMGNLGKDVELRYTASGAAVASTSLACNDRWGSGENRQEHTEWFNLVAWNKTAETMSQYFQKGDPILVEGRMRTHTYEDREGVKRYRTELIVSSFSFIGGQQRQDGGGDDVEFAPSDDEPPLPFE